MGFSTVRRAIYLDVIRSMIKNGDSMSASNKDAANACEKKEVSYEYETPKLIHYGDVRDVTLGGSLGIGESGSTPADPRRNP